VAVRVGVITQLIGNDVIVGCVVLVVGVTVVLEKAGKGDYQHLPYANNVAGTYGRKT